MKDVRITLLVTASAIVGYAAIVMLSGCTKAAPTDNRSYHVTCYSNGQSLIDTESSGPVRGPWTRDMSWSFTERHTGKYFKVSGDCVVALEAR